MKEIDRGLARKPAPRGFAFLFWACLIGLFVFWPADVTQAEPPTEETVAVPKRDLMILQVEHARMRQQLEKQDEALRTLSERAAMCIASFPSAKWQ